MALRIMEVVMLWWEQAADPSQPPRINQVGLRGQIGLPIRPLAWDMVLHGMAPCGSQWVKRMQDNPPSYTPPMVHHGPTQQTPFPQEVAESHGTVFIGSLWVKVQIQ